jgi:hypothetical protein
LIGGSIFSVAREDSMKTSDIGDEDPAYFTDRNSPNTALTLVRDGAVLGMAFDDAAARQDAVDRGADLAAVAAGEYVDGTLAALSGWGDVLIGPESVGLTPDGRVDRIDAGPSDDEDNGAGK